MDKGPVDKIMQAQPKVILHLPRIEKPDGGRNTGGQGASGPRVTDGNTSISWPTPTYDEDYKAEDLSGYSNDEFARLRFPFSPPGETDAPQVEPGATTVVSRLPSVSPLQPAKCGRGRPHGGKVHTIILKIKMEAAGQSSAKTATAAVVLCPMITLLVPLCLLENTNKHTPAMTAEVHQAMDCEAVPTKPKLMYKLIRATKSSSADCLLDGADWLNIINRLEEGELKKAEAVVYIVITEKYLAALVQYLKGTKVSGKCKHVKSPPLNLSNEGPDMGTVDNASVDKTWCLTVPGLGHQVLSSMLLKLWAYSLAANTPKVTLACPPVDGFENFFKKIDTLAVSSVAPAPQGHPAAAVPSVLVGTSPYPSYPLVLPYAPYEYPPFGPVPVGFYPHTQPGAPPTTLAGTGPLAGSSSPPVAIGDEAAAIYPDCMEFMTALTVLNPKCPGCTCGHI
ncbi:hypothetical protein K439DRAFT_1620211 [Ramaria rubella]|nr:hypothetical protein K439DRAFT_1620211 [Ramaria rubella]